MVLKGKYKLPKYIQMFIWFIMIILLSSAYNVLFKDLLWLSHFFRLSAYLQWIVKGVTIGFILWAIFRVYYIAIEVNWDSDKLLVKRFIGVTKVYWNNIKSIHIKKTDPFNQWYPSIYIYVKGKLPIWITHWDVEGFKNLVNTIWIKAPEKCIDFKTTLSSGKSSLD